MLQRIQTIFLLLATGCISIMLFFPLLTLKSGDIFMDFYLYGIKSSDGIIVVDTIWNIILAGMILLINVFSIFLYKHRIRQMRLVIYAILLMIGLYIPIAVQLFTGADLKKEILGFSIPLVMPVIAAILNYMAYRGIRKDEELIKSVDRIR